MALSDLYFFENAFNLINDQFSNFSKINIVDIGVGNGSPALPLLKKLESLNKLNSYTGLDISQTILDTASNTIQSNSIKAPCYYHIIDIENQSLQSILYSLKYSTSELYPTLVLCLGATLSNQTNVIHSGSNVTDGLLPEDRLLVTSGFMADKENKNHFNSSSSVNIFYTWFTKSLGFKDKYVKQEFSYNPKTDFRELNLVFKQDTEVKFTNPNKTLFFDKGDRIKIRQNKRDTFTTISKLADDLHLTLKMVIKHPNYNNIMYMMGKG